MHQKECEFVFYFVECMHVPFPSQRTRGACYAVVYIQVIWEEKKGVGVDQLFSFNVFHTIATDHDIRNFFVGG